MEHNLKYISFKFNPDTNVLSVSAKDNAGTGKIHIKKSYIFTLNRFLVRVFNKMSSKKRRGVIRT